MFVQVTGLETVPQVAIATALFLVPQCFPLLQTNRKLWKERGFHPSPAAANPRGEGPGRPECLGEGVWGA